MNNMTPMFLHIRSMFFCKRALILPLDVSWKYIENVWLYLKLLQENKDLIVLKFIKEFYIIICNRSRDELLALI